MWDMMTQTTYFLLLARSFVGMFEHMSLVLLPWMYPVYYAIFIIGFVGAVIALVQRGIRKKKASVGNVQKIERDVYKRQALPVRGGQNGRDATGRDPVSPGGWWQPG